MAPREGVDGPDHWSRVFVIFFPIGVLYYFSRAQLRARLRAHGLSETDIRKRLLLRDLMTLGLTPVLAITLVLVWLMIYASDFAPGERLDWSLLPPAALGAWYFVLIGVSGLYWMARLFKWAGRWITTGRSVARSDNDLMQDTIFYTGDNECPQGRPPSAT
jgi:hypothetical protein